MKFDVTAELEKFNDKTRESAREFALNLLDKFENYFLEKEGITFEEYMNSGKKTTYDNIRKMRDIVKNSQEIDILTNFSEMLITNIYKTMEKLAPVWEMGASVRLDQKFKEEQNEKIN